MLGYGNSYPAMLMTTTVIVDPSFRVVSIEPDFSRICVGVALSRNMTVRQAALSSFCVVDPWDSNCRTLLGCANGTVERKDPGVVLDLRVS